MPAWGDDQGFKPQLGQTRAAGESVLGQYDAQMKVSGNQSARCAKSAESDRRQVWRGGIYMKTEDAFSVIARHEKVAPSPFWRKG